MSSDVDVEEALPLIRRELIRAAARAEPYMTAREVKELTVMTVQMYDLEMLVEAAYRQDMDFAIGVYRTRKAGQKK